MHRDRTLAIVIAIFVVSTGYLPADAQQTPQYPPSQFQPVVPPRLDPETLKMPRPGYTGDTARRKADGEKDAQPKLQAPSINLGNYDLHFHTGQANDIHPRSGFDSGETSNLSTIKPGRSERALPNYFGLKLTAPTQ
jgi:hypothetical protein